MFGTDDDVGREVLVGVDGSTTSARAVERAVHEAAGRGASLHVVHVAPGPGDGEHGACVLDSAADRAARVDPHVRVRTTLRAGSPVGVLLGAARAAEVVVVGSRRVGTGAAATCGSVAMRLAAASPAPVVVVPPVEARRRTTDVVVGVDGSADADAALHFAFEEARETGGRVVAVCAWRQTPDAGRDDPADRLAVAGRARDDAARTVRAAVDRVRAVVHDGVDVAALVVGRRPEQVLRDLGRGAALTVVGAHGSADVPGTLLGPVVQDVLRRAAGPVAVVRAAAASAA
ncbi:universal stress protein [Cellulosimicrobium sp. NPDC057127]|uniref:universal stress protein n=1 Tax=Cellulosimicrobium sp. NPDC057127 TaxID=3346026 RepID=UPI00363A7DF4